MTGNRKLQWERERSRTARSGWAVVPPATTEQLELIRKLGGHPPDDLTASQANKAISALRHRARQRAGTG